MMQQFAQHWDNTIDRSHLSDHSYVDILALHGLDGVGLMASRLRSEWDPGTNLLAPPTLV